MLANGNSSVHCEQYGRLADTTNHQFLKKFCQGVVDLFEDEGL